MIGMEILLAIVTLACALFYLLWWGERWDNRGLRIDLRKAKESWAESQTARYRAEDCLRITEAKLKSAELRIQAAQSALGKDIAPGWSKTFSGDVQPCVEDD